MLTGTFAAVVLAVAAAPNTEPVQAALQRASEAHAAKRWKDELAALEEAKKHGVPPRSVLVREVRAHVDLGELDAAMKLLSAAADAGFPARPLLEQDPELAPLRADPRYAAVAAKIDANATPCERQPESRQLDFWVGEWDVTVSGAPVGRSSVTKVVRGCALLEKWTSLSGIEGQSLSAWDAPAKQWRQNYFDSTGTISDYRGALDASGAMVMIAGAGGQQLRMTFTRLDDKRVRQKIETSSDGKAWAVGWDSIYTRRM